MGTYQNILLAIDFSEGSDVLGKKAIELAEKYDAQLNLAHVVEPIPDIIDQPMMLDIEQLQELIIENAKNKLESYAERLGILQSPRWLKQGSTKAEIIALVKEQKIDLIVVGRHGRHGLGLLLGSTANAIIHSAPCDVLTVRITE